MVEALLFTGAGAGAGEKNPGAGQKRTGSATLLTVYCICTIAYVFLVENVCLCLACWSFSRWKELGRVLS